MNPKAFLAWQWQDYARNHQDPANLVIHLVAVPMFIVGSLLAPLALLGAHFVWAALGAALFVASLMLQGWGHKRERFAPPPFKNRADFWIRLFAEQYITFPRLVLHGLRLRPQTPDAEKGVH